MQLIEHSDSPRYVRLHDDDNVVVVVNDGGLGEGACFPDGLTLVEAVPQSHKVATVLIAKGEPVRRYGQIIGYALEDLRQGSWVQESQLAMPSAPELDSLPRCDAVPDALPPLEGSTPAMPISRSAPCATWRATPTWVAKRWSSAWAARSCRPAR